MRLIDAGAIEYTHAIARCIDDGHNWNELCVTKDEIDDMPTIEPQQWIPVTERLPEENGDYLVTGRQGAVNKRRYDDGHWYGNWAVVAWMPLPEPWKGGES